MKLYDAIMEAYADYEEARNFVKGWQKEASRRRGVVMTIINAAKKADPEIKDTPAKEIFDHFADVYEADHTAPDPDEAEPQDAEPQNDVTEEPQEPPTGEDPENTTSPDA